jgi:hypothetical protein
VTALPPVPLRAQSSGGAPAPRVLAWSATRHAIVLPLLAASAGPRPGPACGRLWVPDWLSRPPIGHLWLAHGEPFAVAIGNFAAPRIVPGTSGRAAAWRRGADLRPAAPALEVSGGVALSALPRSWPHQPLARPVGDIRHLRVLRAGGGCSSAGRAVPPARLCRHTCHRSERWRPAVGPIASPSRDLDGTRRWPICLAGAQHLHDPRGSPPPCC